MLEDNAGTAKQKKQLNRGVSMPICTKVGNFSLCSRISLWPVFLLIWYTRDSLFECYGLHKSNADFSKHRASATVDFTMVDCSNFCVVPWIGSPRNHLIEYK